ncbi:hypothetical protein J6590_056608 [Homalodisca vitripennis]|nr:hypothetical protein J6590_056608 [Homalodisca vitripennis]
MFYTATNTRKIFSKYKIRSWNSTNLEPVVAFYPGEWLRERSPVCGKCVYIRLVSESYFSFTSMGFFVVIGFDLSKNEYETSKTVPEYKVTYVVSGVALFFVFGAFYSFLRAYQRSPRTRCVDIILLVRDVKQLLEIYLVIRSRAGWFEEGGGSLRVESRASRRAVQKR